MRSTAASAGRVFVLRLEPGEVLHEVVESFVADNGIGSATVTALGGADAGSRITVGPQMPAIGRIVPQTHVLDAPCEFVGTGTVFRDADGRPLMHMHGSAGRSGGSVTGCCRSGIIVWLVMEVVITELSGCAASRRPDPENGFMLLEINE